MKIYKYYNYNEARSKKVGKNLHSEKNFSTQLEHENINILHYYLIKEESKS